MNQQGEHLSNAQIEQYGKRASGAGPETEAWVETHLDDCPSCRSRVLDFQRTRFALLPDQKVNTVPSSDCPSEEDLRNLAAGLCSDPGAAELSTHAAACGHCGPLLREYQEDFSDDVTPEEQAALAQLRSASPEWQRQKAREMLRIRPEPLPGSSPKPMPWIFPWKWLTAPAAIAVACALLALGIGVTLYARRDTPQKMEKRLAKAYTEQRTMEMRWPGAQWAPLQVKLGGTSIEKPETLLEADEVIQAHVAKTPADPEWLRLRLQSDILNDIPPAELARELDQMAQMRQDASVMQELAIAHFRIAENAPSHYLDAKRILDEILHRSPSDTVALFNRAIVEERLDMKDAAAADLKACGKLEKDPAWSKEIQQKLERLP